MSGLLSHRRSMSGFTLLELLLVTSIMGVLASIAWPMYRDYSIQARVTEGVLLLSELRTRVAFGFSEIGELSDNIPASPTPDGQIYGGPYYLYETMFGVPHEMWEQIEYQPKGPNRVIVLRAYRKEEWGFSDIGLHLQVKVKEDNQLAFRCTIDNILVNVQYVPNTCREGNIDDWSW